MVSFSGRCRNKNATTPVPRGRCGTVKSGWLETAHPSVEDGKVRRNVCFGSHSTDCGDSRSIFVKSCGLYYIYELLAPKNYPKRFWGTDEKWSIKPHKIRREINEPEGNLTLYTNSQGNSTTKSVLANKIDGTWANWKVHKENKHGKH